MEGRIRKRGKGSWELTIDLGRDAQGKRQRKFDTVRGKRADADRRLRELVGTLDKGTPLDTGKINVEDYLQRWHLDYATPNTRPRTAERYMVDIRNNLVPHLGHLPLTKLSSNDVRSMEAAMLARGLSPRTVQHAHRVLSEALKHAVEWGLLFHNPCDAVRPPRQVRYEVKMPDPATVHLLLDMARETPLGTAFHFLAYTGVRRGEACGLMWSDIDLVAATAAIQRSAVRITGKGLVMLPPKTERGRRAIALDPETVDILRAHNGEQLIHRTELGNLYKNTGHVFTRLTGAPLDPYVLTDTWRHLVAKAGVPHIRLHDLRHFHASVLLQANTHPKIVQERLGHASISITLDTYSHLIPSLQEQAAQDFARLMRASTRAPQTR